MIYLKQYFGWPDQPSSGLDVTTLIIKMKLQYYMIVNVVIHISKSKVAEMTNKTNKIKKKGLSKVTSFTIHHVYSYREVPLVSLKLLKGLSGFSY